MTKDEFRAILKKHTSYSGGLQCWLVGDEQLDALVAALTAQPAAPCWVVGKARSVMAFVDAYHEHPTRQNRIALAGALVDALTAQPAAPAVVESHDNAMYVAAMQTLLNLGYHWDGGKEWKARNSTPPEGKQS
jgi:hypothetical protein